MSFGYGFGLPSWNTLAGGFSPASLFTQGEQGAWYDPSDLSTMFNDAAGTQPITSFTTNQPVGLLLDKSKGLVLGPELLANTGGPFVSTTGWSVTANGSISVVSGALRLTNNLAVVNRAFVSLTTVIGTTYLFETNVVAFSGGLAGGRLAAGTTSTSEINGSTLIAGNGVQQLRFRATATTTFVQLVTYGSSSGGAVDFAYATVRELPGNHATQTSGSARPVLSKRYNLLTYSEEFDQGVWTKSNATVTANAATAPDNTLTADAFVESTDVGSTFHYILQNFTVTNAVSYTFSVYAKYANRQWIVLTGNRDNWQAYFDIQNGVVGNRGSLTTASSITDVGNGWYRCSVTVTADSGISVAFMLAPATANGTSRTPSYVGNGSIAAYIWGADLRRTIDANAFQPAYQRVVTATDYDGDGFLPYLEYSGAQAMSTGSIDFTATDKMTVWSGMRRNITSTAFPVEFSAQSDANNGTFGIGNDSGGAEYFFNSRGTTLRQVSIDNAAYNAPVSNVVTLSADIAAPSLVARLNGTQVGSNTSSQGTGNFGNYPLYIGARNLASFFLNGRLYSLIVRGAQSSAAQISATESWVAQRTGVSL